MGEEYLPTYPFDFLIGFFLFISFFPIGWILCRPKRSAKWLGALFLPSVLVLSWIVGATDQGNAYQDCMKKGEQLRGALSQYHKIHGHYPDDLTQLGWTTLPGKRFIGSTILKYEIRKDGYKMHFSGGPTSVVATESEPFEQLFM